MKQSIKTQPQTLPPKTPARFQFVYSAKKELIAIHLFTGGTLYGYNRNDTGFSVADNSSNWDNYWFGNYE